MYKYIKAPYLDLYKINVIFKPLSITKGNLIKALKNGHWSLGTFIKNKIKNIW